MAPVATLAPTVTASGGSGEDGIDRDVRLTGRCIRRRRCRHGRGPIGVKDVAAGGIDLTRAGVGPAESNVYRTVFGVLGPAPTDTRLGPGLAVPAGRLPRVARPGVPNETARGEHRGPGNGAGAGLVHLDVDDGVVVRIRRRRLSRRRSCPSDRDHFERRDWAPQSAAARRAYRLIEVEVDGRTACGVASIRGGRCWDRCSGHGRTLERCSVWASRQVEGIGLKRYVLAVGRDRRTRRVARTVESEAPLTPHSGTCNRELVDSKRVAVIPRPGWSNVPLFMASRSWA